MLFKKPGEEFTDLENREDVDRCFAEEGTTQHSINEVPYEAEVTATEGGEEYSDEEVPFQSPKETSPF